MGPLTRLVACFPLILVMAACASRETCLGLCGQGSVINAATEQPVAGAEVCLFDRAGRRSCVFTGGDGRYVSGVAATEHGYVGHGGSQANCPNHAVVTAAGFASMAISLSPGCVQPAGGFPTGKMTTARLSPGDAPLCPVALREGAVILISRAASERDDDARGIDYREFIDVMRGDDGVTARNGLPTPFVHHQAAGELFEMSHVGPLPNYRPPRHRLVVSYARTCDGFRKTRAVADALGARLFTAIPSASAFQTFEAWESL